VVRPLSRRPRNGWTRCGSAAARPAARTRSSRAATRLAASGRPSGNRTARRRALPIRPSPTPSRPAARIPPPRTAWPTPAAHPLARLPRQPHRTVWARRSLRPPPLRVSPRRPALVCSPAPRRQSSQAVPGRRWPPMARLAAGSYPARRTAPPAAPQVRPARRTRARHPLAALRFRRASPTRVRRLVAARLRRVRLTRMRPLAGEPPTTLRLPRPVCHCPACHRPARRCPARRRPGTRLRPRTPGLLRPVSRRPA